MADRYYFLELFVWLHVVFPGCAWQMRERGQGWADFDRVDQIVMIVLFGVVLPLIDLLLVFLWRRRRYSVPRTVLLTVVPLLALGAGWAIFLWP